MIFLVMMCNWLTVHVWSLSYQRCDRNRREVCKRYSLVVAQKPYGLCLLVFVHVFSNMETWDYEIMERCVLCIAVLDYVSNQWTTNTIGHLRKNTLRKLVTAGKAFIEAVTMWGLLESPKTDFPKVGKMKDRPFPKAIFLWRETNRDIRPIAWIVYMENVPES